MNNIVVLASGSGTNFRAIIEAAEQGEISGQISGLITNKPDIGAITYAQKFDIPVQVIIPEEYTTEVDFSNALLKQFQNWEADLIVLAGYLKKIPSAVIQAFPNRILNIHPALLPKYGGKGFYGLKVHQAVIDAGDPESGCTVHIVTEEFDKGPILAQVKVPVKQDDTPELLAQRILKEEHQLYPKVIQEHLTKSSA
ncbi:MAG: phosphoribosylglycinamide formyltransferase [Balneolaceae bacterium]